MNAFTNQGAFSTELRTRVDMYFENNRISRTGNWKLYLKSVVLVTAAITIYLLLLFVDMPAYVSILLCVVFGFTLACVGFNIMHDACHGAYSDRKWINNLLGYSLNALGGNCFLWKWKHNIHHAYTSVDGMDNDIDKSPLLRQCESQKWIPIHRYQHIYVVFFYAIASLAWIFGFEFKKYFTRRVTALDITNMKLADHIIFWVSKILYLILYGVLPAILLGFNNWLIGFIIMHVSMGFTLSFVFQLGHVVEPTSFISVDELQNHQAGRIEWAEHQVRSTANFAIDNAVISWFVGGLNYQVEHHLFPRVCHIHYPALSTIVRKACADYHLPYHCYPNMQKALDSHFRQMRALGLQRLDGHVHTREGQGVRNEG